MSEVGMNVEYSKNRSYIIPLLAEYIEINKGLFVNSYIFDINRPEYNVDKYEGLFLLFKWSNNQMHKHYEQKLMDSPYVKDHYDIDSDYYMIFCKFPEEIQRDVEKIIEGKFSKISEYNKKTIMRYWPQASSSSKIYGVLYKTDKLKKQMEEELNVKLEYNCELGSIFNLHKETFNNLIKKVEIDR